MPMGPERVGYATAIGVGAMIGIERERRKGQGAHRAFAGLRTFTLSCLLGAVAGASGSIHSLPLVLLMIGGLTLIAYQRDAAHDPGITTEVALLLTVMLGAMAMKSAPLAAALGVVVTGLLLARTQLHRWAGEVLSEQELRDGLILAVCALVLLPLMPDRTVGPFSVLNPRALWQLLVLVLSLNACGYVAVRALGPRLGLAFAGLASGFVSSAATIAAMGARAAATPGLRHGAVAGASLSSLATVAQLAMVAGATDLETLMALMPSLLAAGAVALVYGAYFAWRGWRRTDAAALPAGRAFRLRDALSFVALVAAVLLVSAAATAWLGQSGTAIAAAAAGFGDAHSPAIAVAALVAAGKMHADAAVVPVLLAFSTNAVTKLVLARSAGDAAFARALSPGIVLMTVAAWLAASL